MNPAQEIADCLRPLIKGNYFLTVPGGQVWHNHASQALARWEAAMKEGESAAWRAMEDITDEVRAGREVLVCGDRLDPTETFPDWYPCQSAGTAYYTESSLGHSHWIGENAGAHDECYYWRPKAWMPLPLPVVHASDCALHNEPAMPKGSCDCGALAPASAPEGGGAERVVAGLLEALERLTEYIGALKGSDDAIAAYEDARAAIAKAQPSSPKERG